MAMNSKKRKFLAQSLTATMVAAAVAPAAGFAAEVEKPFSDVELGTPYTDPITKLKEAGVITGYSDGTFKIRGQVTRAEAAQMFTSIRDLDKNVAAAPFADVKQGVWYSEAINAAYAADVISGNPDGTFKPNGNLTRAEFAVMVVKAYDLELKTDVELPFNDVKENVWYTDYIKTLYANDLIAGKTATTFAPGENVDRGDFAILLAKTDIEFGDKLKEEEVAPEVESVSAINSTTLSLTGTGLTGLKAEDITLVDNEVSKVVASEDGKSATVTFKHSFTNEVEQTVKIGEKSYNFTYTFSEVKTVSLDAAVYDDDTAGQLLAFKVNGESMTTDSEFLRQSGYTVNFVAVNSSNAAGNIFYASGGATNTSSTGLLNDTLTPGKYTVEIQILKGGDIVVSDKAEITVTDVESTTSAISDLRFENTTNSGKKFKMNSTTLVIDETAVLDRVIGNAGGKTNVVIPLSGAIIKSSNPAVISVDPSTLELTANATGTAQISVTIGTITKTVNFTVVNKDRVVSKITPNQTTVKVVKGQTRTIQVTTVDQYGDPIEVVSGDPAVGSTAIKEDAPENAASVPLVTAADLVTDPEYGIVTGGYDIQAVEVGNGTLLFKNLAGDVLGKVAIQVTDVVTDGGSKVEYTVGSDTTSNSIVVGDVNEYQVAKYTKAGFFNGLWDLNTSLTAGEYTVDVADSSVLELTVTDDVFTVEGLKAGKSDVHIKDENGQTVHKFTVTVGASAYAITKVNFTSTPSVIDYKGKLIDVSTVLDVRPAIGSADSIVYGIEHNVPTVAKVYLNTTDADAPVLYLDVDSTTVGGLDAGDIVLGAVKAEILSGAKGTMTSIIGGIDIAPGSYTTDLTDEGTILFRVVAPNATGTFNNINTVASTVINVKVK